MKFPILPTLTPADLEAMPEAERRDLLLRLVVFGQQVQSAQALVAASLAVQRDEPLWDADQTAAVLGVSNDTVRQRGGDWGIEADLGPGLRRFVPERVRALRERRKAAEPTRLARLALTNLLPST